MHFLHLYTRQLWHRNPVEIRFSLTDRPVLVPKQTMRKWNRISYLGVKRPLHGLNHPPSSTAEIKERVQP
jgi:hypothetical protein